MKFIAEFGIGMLTGILSGFGLGGGSLLLVYLTGVAGVGQTEAQGINLLYFLPAAFAALPSHFKNKFVDKKVAVPAILSGLVCAALGAWTATGMEVEVLRKLFGIFLLVIGLRELFVKSKKEED